MRYIVLYFFSCLNMINAQQDSIVELPNSYFLFTKEREGLYSKKRFNSDSILIEDGYSKKIDINDRYNKCKFYYDTGILKMEGYFDKKNKPNGLFLYYYSNGKIAKKDFFSHGNKKGKNINYYEEQHQLKSQGYYGTKFINQYPIELKKGKWVYFYKNGTKKSEGRFYFRKVLFKKDLFQKPSKYIGGTPIYDSWKKDVKHGKWKYWNDRGVLVKVENYKKGELINIENPKRKKGVQTQKPAN